MGKRGKGSDDDVFGRLTGRIRNIDTQETERVPLKLKDIIFFAKFAKPGWKMLAVSLVLTLFIAIISSLLPLTTKIFIDFVILKQGESQAREVLSWIGMESATQQVVSFLGSVDNVIILIVVFGIAYSLLQGVRTYLMMRYEQELTFNVQSELFDNVLRYPLAYFKSKHTGYLVSRVMGDVQQLQFLFSGLLITMLSQVFYLISSLAILLTLSPRVTLIVICAMPLYLAINFVFSGRIKAINHVQRELSAQIYKDMHELLTGIEVIKTYVTGDRELGKVTKRLRESMRLQITSRITGSASTSMMRGVQYLITLAVMWYGAHEILNGNMTVGDYVAFMTYILLLSGAVGSLFSTYLNIQPTIASVERLTEMFNVTQEYEKEEKDRKGTRPESFDGRIRFEHVSFAYQVDKPVLEDVSFDLDKGETIALVGASGAGKTTTINLLLKFYEPQQGSVCLDNHDIRELDTVWLRKQIAMVPQDVFLFDDTIENNIRYARPGATRDEVIAAAKRAQVHDDIMRLKGNYDAMVGERGTLLSTGQRQRISIARAFLKDAPILILDEPTSALDIETERLLKESMRDLIKGRTTIVISHRMSLTDVADKVLVVKNGRVVQYGSRRELIAVEGPYKHMCAPDAVIN